MAVAACSLPSASAEPARRIFLIEGLAPWQPGGAASHEAFRQRLREKSSVNHEIYLDYLELGRFPGQAHEERMARFLAEKFAQNPPHLLVPNGPGSLRLLVRHRDAIAPGVPIVYCCATDAALDALDLPRDVVGVVMEYNWAETLALAARLQPGVRDLVLISGASELDKVWRERALGELAPHLPNYHVRSLFDVNYDDLLKEMARLPRDTIVLQISVFADAAGRRFFLPDAATGIAAASSAPVYSAVPSLLGRGIVGGYLDSFEAQGRAAADLALEILAGKDPATLPPRTRPPHTHAVDANALARWSMSESALPPGAAVLFRQPTVWDQYRAQAAGAIAVVLLQAALIAWLLFEHRGRRVAEQELRRRLLEVIHLNRTATASALSASIAHELNQPLGAILSYAEAAELYLKADPPNLPRVKQILANIRRDDQRAAEIIRHFRGLMKKKDAIELEEFDVNDVVRTTLHILESEASKRGVLLSVNQGEGLLPVRADHVQLQQVILNLAVNGMDAMQNCATGDGRMSIQTALVGKSEVEVQVADSGTGIPADKLTQVFDTFYTTKRMGTGLGLPISRAIVETYGGRIWAENLPDGGAAFRFTLPLSRGVSA